MKIGWILFDEYSSLKPEFWVTEPESWRGTVVQIVYDTVDNSAVLIGSNPVEL